jgi:hypothetical protein
MKLTIEITDNFEKTQQQFSSFFNLLKIQFYDANHRAGEGTDKSHELPLNSEWSSYLTKNCSIDLSENMKVSEFEKLFSETTGVGVQVFRKSNTAWLQTIATDSWSLKEQQLKSEEMERPVQESVEPEDYHEQK